MNAKKLLFVLLILMGITTQNNAQAQQQQAKIPHDSLVFNASEVVVSARRWEQKAIESSHPVYSFAIEKTLLFNPQTAADLLGFTNKVFMQKSQQGGGSPMIRGFATNRLFYSVDGVRMNTAIFRSGNIQNVISIDPFSVQHSEVILGAAPVVYGSDGIGGVMMFETLKPILSDKEDGEMIAKYNSDIRFSSANNEKTGHFDLKLGWEKWASVTSFSYNDFGNLKMGAHGPAEYLRPHYASRIDNKDVTITNTDPLIQNPSGYTQYNIMQKIYFEPSDKWNFTYSLIGSESSNYSRYDRLVRNKKAEDGTLFPAYGDWYYGPQKWLMNSFTISHNAEHAAFDGMKIIAANQLFEESRHDRNFNNNTLHSRTEKVNAWSLNADFFKQAMDKLSLYYGAEFIANNVESLGSDINIANKTSQAAGSRYPQADWYSLAAYILGDYKLSDLFTLEAGLRYNQYMLNADFDTTFYKFPFTSAEINDGALTGNIGLIYHPTSTLSMQANLSTAFRSPNVDDLGKVFDSHAGYVSVPNPDLKAEYAYSANLGITKHFNSANRDRSYINANVYYTYLQDAMVRRDFTMNGQDSLMYDGQMCKVEAIQNAAGAYIYGLDAELNYRLPSNFFVNLYANLQVGEEELDDGSTSTLRHAAPFFGSAAIGYTATNFTLNLYANYSAERAYDNLPEEEKGKSEIYAIDANGNPYCPAWWTVNFKAEYKLSSNLAVSAGLENILDKRYRPYSSGIVSAGRNFVLAFRFFNL